MELHDMFYLISEQANLDGQDVKVLVNGQDNDIRLKSICKRVEFETGKIRATSILEYYTVVDGFLTDKEGNQISLSCERYPEIKFVKIKEPGLQMNDKEVSHTTVRDMGRLLNLQITEETITGLSKEEKKALRDERELIYAEIETKKKEEEAVEAQKLAEEEAKAAEEAQKLAEDEETKKTEAAAKKAREDAEKAQEEAKQAEVAAEKARQDEEEAKWKAEESAKKAEEAEEIKKSAHLLSQRDFDKSLKHATKVGMKEYVKDGYHFFYGTDLPEEDHPFILVERGKGKYEDLPCALVDVDQEKGTVDAEFDDGQEEMYLKLNVNKETMSIEPY